MLKKLQIAFVALQQHSMTAAVRRKLFKLTTGRYCACHCCGSPMLSGGCAVLSDLSSGSWAAANDLHVAMMVEHTNEVRCGRCGAVLDPMHAVVVWGCAGERMDGCRQEASAPHQASMTSRPLAVLDVAICCVGLCCAVLYVEVTRVSARVRVLGSHAVWGVLAVRDAPVS